MARKGPDYWLVSSLMGRPGSMGQGADGVRLPLRSQLIGLMT